MGIWVVWGDDCFFGVVCGIFSPFCVLIKLQVNRGGLRAKSFAGVWVRVLQMKLSLTQLSN